MSDVLPPEGTPPEGTPPEGTPPDGPPEEPLAPLFPVTLAAARTQAERNVRLLRGELHALNEAVQEKQRMLHHEIGALDAFVAMLEQLNA